MYILPENKFGQKSLSVSRASVVSVGCNVATIGACRSNLGTSTGDSCLMCKLC